MKTGKINELKPDTIDNPELRKAFEWIIGNWDIVHESGEKKIVIDGEKVFANIDNPIMRSKKEQILEVHRIYTDIHVPVDKTEVIGYRGVDGLRKVVAEYDEELDRAFYSDEPENYITLNPGEYAIMTPQDGHAPIIGEGKVKKICVKVML